MEVNNSINDVKRRTARRMTKPSSTLLAKVPKELIHFFSKALVLFIVWKLGYVYFLSASLDQLFTRITALSTWVIYDLFSAEKLSLMLSENFAQISVSGKPVLIIGDPCNALELFVLYTGFILCIGGALKRRAGFILTGLLLIFLANISRCLLLLWLAKTKSPLFYAAHTYIFTFLIYSLIFVLWMKFMGGDRRKPQAATNPSKNA
ncbi:hypothetical protein [Pedobacter sp. SYSU D00535]|uniref:hypothetical protein n=1 Tax=Pedobacter sp. SYSU D00535 TaxID=2810308 RepID=UPI001A95A48D|nr:hypothetical protein [Pedobacter sp. SYSU D00535]